jgi:hypothetical protein
MEEVNQRDKGYHLVVKVVILVSLKHEDRNFEGNSLNFEVLHILKKLKKERFQRKESF